MTRTSKPATRVLMFYQSIDVRPVTCVCPKLSLREGPGDLPFRCWWFTSDNLTVTLTGRGERLRASVRSNVLLDCILRPIAFVDQAKPPIEGVKHHDVVVKPIRGSSHPWDDQPIERRRDDLTNPLTE